VGSLLRLPSRPWEVGGWLLGYWAEDRSSVVVTHATPPAVRGTAFGVTISGKGHRERFDQAWDRSGGLVTFLGDWHTHPGGPAIPSGQDTRAMRQLATDAHFGTPEPLMAIVSNPRWPRSPQIRQVRLYVRASDSGLRELDPVPLAALPEPACAVPKWAWPHIGMTCREGATRRSAGGRRGGSTRWRAGLRRAPSGRCRRCPPKAAGGSEPLTSSSQSRSGESWMSCSLKTGRCSLGSACPVDHVRRRWLPFTFWRSSTATMALSSRPPVLSRCAQT
jgi:integrative and conjugative element protein (TIGR02256 family)